MMLDYLVFLAKRALSETKGNVPNTDTTRCYAKPGLFCVEITQAGCCFRQCE